MRINIAARAKPALSRARDNRCGTLKTPRAFFLTHFTPSHPSALLRFLYAGPVACVRQKTGNDTTMEARGLLILYVHSLHLRVNRRSLPELPFLSLHFLFPSLLYLLTIISSRAQISPGVSLDFRGHSFASRRHLMSEPSPRRSCEFWKATTVMIGSHHATDRKRKQGHFQALPTVEWKGALMMVTSGCARRRKEKNNVLNISARQGSTCKEKKKVKAF